MRNNLEFALVLNAVDRFSRVFNQLNDKTTELRKKLDKVRESSERLGRGMVLAGTAAAYAMTKPIEAFAELENASVRLKTVMMDKNGMVGAFEQVNALAVKLGDRMPGTSADFLNMMATLKAYNLSDASILGGVGEAAANLGVLLKMAPEAAAEFAAKMKNATGTSDKDMMGLMDTIQRLNFMGVEAIDMMYAFGRSGGALKTFKIQGLEATKALAPLYAMLNKNGLSGETVGTGFASILSNMADKKKLGKANALLGKGQKLSLFDANGQIKPIRELVAQFDKLKNLDPVKLNAVLKELTGGGQDQQMLAQIITNGLVGYDKMLADMEAQADLQRRVNAQLSTLANLWDAATGTFRNMLAGFASAMGPELKALAQWFGEFSLSVGAFIKQNPVLSKWIGIIALGAIALALGMGTMALAVAGAIRVFTVLLPILGFAAKAIRIVGVALMWMGRMAMANPIGLLITVLAGAAYLIYKNWDWLKGKFKQFFSYLTTEATRVGSILHALLLPFKAVKWIVDKTVQLTGHKPVATRAPSAVTPGNNSLVGKVDININNEGRIRVGGVKSSNPRVPLNVNTGRTMVMP